MRPPRLRIRTLMILVAVVGMGIGGYPEFARWQRLRADYQRLAQKHGLKAAFAMRQVTLTKQGLEVARLGFSHACEASCRDFWAEEVEKDERVISEFQRRADYHAGLARKYTEAARYPWRSLSPDPPEPEEPSGLEVEPPMPPPLSVE